MTADDILQSIHYTDPAFTLDTIDQARQLLREHEAWISVDLLATQINEVIPTTSIHFTPNTF